MHRVRSGFQAAKFHGKVACAEWPNGTTGADAISGCPVPPGETVHQRLEAPLAVRRRVPVLGAALDEGHRHAQPVHFPAERLAPEQDLFRHVLVAVQDRLHLGRVLGQTEIRPVPGLAGDIVEMRLGSRGER